MVHNMPENEKIVCCFFFVLFCCFWMLTSSYFSKLGIEQFYTTFNYIYLCDRGSGFVFTERITIKHVAVCSFRMYFSLSLKFENNLKFKKHPLIKQGGKLTDSVSASLAVSSFLMTCCRFSIPKDAEAVDLRLFNTLKDSIGLS